MKKRAGLFLKMWMICGLLAVVICVAAGAAPAQCAASAQSVEETQVQAQGGDALQDTAAAPARQTLRSCVFRGQALGAADNLSMGDLLGHLRAGRTSGLIPAPPLQGATIPRERGRQKSAV